MYSFSSSSHVSCSDCDYCWDRSVCCSYCDSSSDHLCKKSWEEGLEAPRGNRDADNIRIKY
ncbi:hypothetical protein PO909_000451 [Leuciscus waleckii]